MAKKDTKQLREETTAEKQRALQQGQSFESQYTPERAAARERAGQLYGSITPRLENIADTGGVDKSVIDAVTNKYLSFGDTGIDPTKSKTLSGFYGNQMTTGGYTPQDTRNIRARSQAGNAAIFGRLRDRLGNAARSSGGYAPGLGAVSAKLGRQAAQEAATTSRENEIAIADAVRSGKMAGATGLSNLAGLESEARLRSLGGALGGQELLQKGRLGGVGGLMDMYRTNQDEVQNIDAARLKSMGLTNDQITQVLASRKYLSSTPGMFGNIMQGLGAGAGILGSLSGFKMPSFGGGGAGDASRI